MTCLPCEERRRLLREAMAASMRGEYAKAARALLAMTSGEKPAPKPE